MSVHGKLKVSQFADRGNVLLMIKPARLVQTLGQVQSKLQQLNEENGISRRRVRELEMELEDCRRDVARERTRVLEKESAIIEQQKELHGIASRAKGKAKQTEEDAEDILNRYQNAVAEKKGVLNR